MGELLRRVGGPEAELDLQRAALERMRQQSVREERYEPHTPTATSWVRATRDRHCGLYISAAALRAAGMRDGDCVEILCRRAGNTVTFVLRRTTGNADDLRVHDGRVGGGGLVHWLVSRGMTPAVRVHAVAQDGQLTWKGQDAKCESAS